MSLSTVEKSKTERNVRIATVLTFTNLILSAFFFLAGIWITSLVSQLIGTALVFSVLTGIFFFYGMYSRDKLWRDNLYH